MNNEFKKYIVDVCNFIDCLFTIAVIVELIKFIVQDYTFTDADRIMFYIGMAGVALWPNRKYVAKWLKVDYSND